MGPAVRRALLAVYLVLLAWAVLWKLEVPHTGGYGRDRVQLVPFGLAGGDHVVVPSEIAANLLLFVPLAVLLGLLAPARPWWWPVAVTAGTSLALEAVQLALAVGIADVTDLLVNTAGGLAGAGLLALARRTLRERAAVVVTRVCAVAVGLAVLGAAAFVASPVRYTAPDVPRLHEDVRTGARGAGP